MTVIVLTALVVAAIAGAERSTPAPASPEPPAANEAAGLAAVPTDQARAFGVLRGPAASASSVALAVRSQISTGSDALRGFGLDLDQVRAVKPAGQTFYVAPAQEGVCLFLEDGTSACTQDIAAVARYGLSLSVVPPGADAGQIVTYGIVGDGVVSITGHTTSGQDVRASMAGNAYTMVTDAPVDRTQFSSAASSWTTASAPKPVPTAAP